MRNRYLGDSLDLAKAALLLLAREIDLSVLVAPLPAESEFDFELYGQLLGIGTRHALAGAEMGVFSGRNRAAHLAALREALLNGRQRGLLLDPDSGLKNGDGVGPRFLTPGELQGMTHRSGVVWLLYHHQGAGRLDYRAAAKLAGADWYYNLGKAALLVGGHSDLSQRLLLGARQGLNPARCFVAAGGA